MALHARERAQTCSGAHHSTLVYVKQAANKRIRIAQRRERRSLRAPRNNISHEQRDRGIAAARTYQQRAPLRAAAAVCARVRIYRARLHHLTQAPAGKRNLSLTTCVNDQRHIAGIIAYARRRA